MNVGNWLRRLLRFARPVPGPETLGRAPVGEQAARAPKRGVGGQDLLQFSDSPKGPTTDIVIGFDFGTSCAKAAIQSPYKLGGRVVLVNFRDLGHRASSHLLPVMVHQDPDGRLSLRKPPVTTEVRGHLKVELLDDPGEQAGGTINEAEALAWAVVFVGLVLREIRLFFLETQFDNYGTDRIRWSLNLGVPSAGYGDDAIRKRFEVIAKGGWLLSLQPGAPTLEVAREVIETFRVGFGEDVDVAVIPELVAGVVAYVKSRQRRQGLHLILDIGASTIDLCSFSLHQRDGEDVFPLLTADVQLLGLLDLHWRRMEACGRVPPFDKIPEDLVESLPEWERATLSLEISSRLRQCDREFRDRCAHRVLIRTLLDLKQRRDPHSQTWNDGLPLFITGGGAHSPMIQAFVTEANRIGSTYWTPYKGLRRHHLLWPDTLEPNNGATAADFLRFAVAFGLSFPPINIGRIEAPEEISDIPRDERPRDWRHAYVDKGQV